MSTRREWLKQLLKQAALAAGLSGYGYQNLRYGHPRGRGLAASGENPPFKIGACDWSIGQRGKTEALALAKKIGVEGVQVSLGTSPENMHLLREEVQQQYLEAAREHGVAIGGLAIGALNQVPYKSSRRAEEWVRQSVDVAEALGVGVVLLAFFGAGFSSSQPSAYAGTAGHSRRCGGGRFTIQTVRILLKAPAVPGSRRPAPADASKPRRSRSFSEHLGP